MSSKPHNTDYAVPVDERQGDTVKKSASEIQIRPSFFAKVFVNHTRKTCAVGIIIPILCILIIIATNSLSLSGNSNREFFVISHETAKLADGRTAARDDYPYIPETDGTQSLKQRETDLSKNLNIIIRGKIKGSNDEVASLENFDNSENVLTRESFILHKQIEDIYFKNESYSKFCKKEPGVLDCDSKPRECSLPVSYLNHPLLFGKLNDDGSICGRRDDSNLTQDNFDQFVSEMFGNDSRNSKNYFDVNLSSTDQKAWTAKSTILIGLPFADFNSSNDDVSEQSELYIDWGKPLTAPINDDDSKSTDKYDVYVLSSDLSNDSFASLIINDLTLAVIAIILVLIVIWIHTTSLVLTGSAITQVLLAFPFAYFFYYFVFRQLYFSTLQILTIFLILGIGADDVFVFTDAWKQAEVVLGKDVDLVSRMSWTYRRAVRAMTVTSFTTAAAFFVTAVSPIMPISTLGVWAGSLVVFQFILVIVVYPCAVVTWHRFWRPRLFIKGFKKVEEDELEKELATPFYYRILPKSIRPEIRIRAQGEYRSVEKFFRGPWMKFLQFSKYILIVLAILLLGGSIWRATTLETPLEAESFLPSDHPFNVALETLSDGFPRGDADLQLKVWIVWGIKGANRNGLDRYDVDEIGTPEFDKSFDLKKASTQQQILKACSFFGDNKELIFQDNTTGIDPIDCWIQDYRQWRIDVGKSDSFVTFESDKALVQELLDFGNHTENGVQPYITYLTNQRIGFDRKQERVLFTEIEFIGDIEASAPESQMTPIYDLWQEEMDKFNEQGDESNNKAYATSGFGWMWMYTQQTLLRTMLQGLGIMIVVALITLLISTRNIIIAFIATVCIGGVIATLLGFISISGWHLGVTESVSVIIGIGYSFDGVAHVATAYVESKEFERHLKMKHALTELGISVFFGAISTLCAGLALTPAVITFFTKFATLLIVTVILSLIWSLVFFPAILLVIGPNGEFGSILKLFSCFRRSDRQETPSIQNQLDKSDVER